MASHLWYPLLLVAIFLLMQTSDCFIHSRAAFYPNSDENGTDIGACGFGSFGATINGGDVSAASDLYRGGVGCGACYQVRCTDTAYCSSKGVTVVITDQGSSHGTDFVLSQRAFSKMAQTADAAASLLSIGVGMKDITAVQLCETQNSVCKLLDRSYGAVWTTTTPPSGPLQVRMLFSDDDGDETWLVPVNNIPEDWKAGETYDTGVQVNI
ncbi:hypothetical protein FEM48_Zijuj11G0079100 [Ziziphus jujuba var. spinosa]|uniref:Expansin-like B1 n=1 Tax=Ziziphus jujuba var. spinosa TaxID=714518 RepID=A0A978UHR3_ZIZJJ|nr:hypothetical protein FEM48_Zijuj11G0079100 [Ziziphus jujuba var. spinosa]